MRPKFHKQLSYLVGCGYQFDEKVFLRKGTNVFAAKPEELLKLHRGEYVI
jgi:hypothetical protein